MNDFTKEELEFINMAINPFDWLFDGDFKLLKDKLQSMIDNYCEHDCNGEVEIFVDTCKKCHACLLRSTHLGD